MEFDDWIAELRRDHQRVSVEKCDDGGIKVSYVDCYTDKHSHYWHNIQNWWGWHETVWPALRQYYA